jgi:hypothetical protein
MEIDTILKGLNAVLVPLMKSHQSLHEDGRDSSLLIPPPLHTPEAPHRACGQQDCPHTRCGALVLARVGVGVVKVLAHRSPSPRSRRPRSRSRWLRFAASVLPCTPTCACCIVRSTARLRVGGMGVWGGGGSRRRVGGCPGLWCQIVGSESNLFVVSHDTCVRGMHIARGERPRRCIGVRAMSVPAEPAQFTHALRKKASVLP